MKYIFNFKTLVRLVIFTAPPPIFFNERGNYTTELNTGCKRKNINSSVVQKKMMIFIVKSGLVAFYVYFAYESNARITVTLI